MNCVGCGAPLESKKCKYCGRIADDFQETDTGTSNNNIEFHCKDCGCTNNPIVYWSDDILDFNIYFYLKCPKCKNQTQTYSISKFNKLLVDGYLDMIIGNAINEYEGE